MFRRGVFALLGLVMLCLPASARPGDWELLGQQKVGFLVDRDVIKVGAREGAFTTIELRVTGNAIEFLDLKVIYANGTVDDIPVRRIVRAGGTTGPLDLKGQARRIDRVQMVYRSKPNFRGQATISLYGREARGGPGGGGGPGLALPPGRWEVLGKQSVGFGVDRDVVRVGRREGRFNAILLRVRGNDIEMRDLKVRYGNGSVEDIQTRLVMRAGSQSRVIDLKGRGRIIESIQLIYSSRPNFRGRAEVEVWGLHGR